MKRPTQEEIDRLKAKHGDLVELSATVNGRDYYVIARLPNVAEYDRVLVDVTRISPRSAHMNLLRSCVVFPSGGMIAMFEQAPGLVIHFGDELLKAAGAAAEVLAKKL